MFNYFFIMIRPVVNITITQKGMDRTKILFFDFINSFEVSSDWTGLTDNGTVILPKNIYAVDKQNNKRFAMFGKNKNIGGFDKTPLLMRGDAVKIETYYIYWDENLNGYKTNKEVVFEGYITNIKSKMPIEFDVEDNMYLLKQVQMKTQSFKENISIETILTEAINNVNSVFGTKLSVNILSETKIKWQNGLLTAENETVAQFLAKLKKEAFLKCYFKGDELRVGGIIYLENEAVTKKFHFQENIISHELEYKRKDDVILTAVASNYITESNGTTKDGQIKTKKRRIEVVVTFKNNKFESRVVGKNEKIPDIIEGEKRTFVYPFAENEQDLINLAKSDLEKYYYTGFKGRFSTFGTPFIKFGDNVVLENNILPEQNGTYKVKAVNYSGGVNGLRQNIELDYKLNV